MKSPRPTQVLIVEDDFDTCENLRDILELDRHSVSIAHSAEEALQQLASRPVAMVLLDWRLPDATALDLLPALRSCAPDSDVVIITGHEDFTLAVAALREGAADYLLKPINAEALRNSIRRLARERWLAAEKVRADSIFRNLVQAAPCLIAILRRDLSAIYFSPFGEALTGYSLADLEEQSFVKVLLGEKDRERAEQLLKQVSTGMSLQGCQLPIRCQDGSMRWMMWNAQWLEDIGGEPGILTVGHDITEARRANERLVQSERLSAIGEAMTGLAHESRNALQRSQAFLELLAAEVAGNSAALRLVARIQEAQEHLHQLYEEVRQYAAPLRIEPHRYAVDELIQETWAYLELSRQNRDARLIACDLEGAADVEVDRFLIQQVFRNILENSLAACSDPVEIRFASSLIQDNEGAWRRISISDNGPGLNPEQRQRIFDPFYTTKSSGTGLGMTLCKRIVEAHGGRIAIGPGQGTEILIDLPNPLQP